MNVSSHVQWNDRYDGWTQIDRLIGDLRTEDMSQTIAMASDIATRTEIAHVDTDGLMLVCHHPREGIWCCCVDDGHAPCSCAPDLDGAIRAWYRNERIGE
jgi:hypothetical protein